MLVATFITCTRMLPSRTSLRQASAASMSLDPLTGTDHRPYANRAQAVSADATRLRRPRLVARSQLTLKVSPRASARTGALLTVEEVGERLRLSRTSIYRLVERRQLPFYRLPGSLRFSEEDVALFLAERRVETIERQHL